MARTPRKATRLVVPGFELDLADPPIVTAPGENLIETVEAARSKSIINTSTRSDEEKQRIATPRAFTLALEHRFGMPVDFDLAADKNNAKAEHYFSLETDSLKQDWSRIEVFGQAVKLAYLNPPFAHIKPWARKLAECRWLKRWTAMLVPASFSTDWFLELEDVVHRDAIPRIQFEGNDTIYPKDLSLIVAGFGMTGDGYWDWRVSYALACRERGIEPDPKHLKGVTRLPTKAVFPDYAWTPNPFEAE